jgi:hypothetical protein
VAFNLLLFAFKYFNTILSSRVSFLFLFLLVFVLHIEGKGPRCSDGEFDSCAIYLHVTLLCKGACTSSISADDWDDTLSSTPHLIRREGEAERRQSPSPWDILNLCDLAPPLSVNCAAGVILPCSPVPLALGVAPSGRGIAA